MDDEKEMPDASTSGNKENLNVSDIFRLQLNEKEVKNQALSPIDNILDELQRFDQWVVWKKAQGKNTKRPYDAKTLQAASVDDLGTWSNYDQATEAVKSGKVDGVGFVLTSDDPYTFIDLDNVIVDGRINSYAKNIIDALSSYTEISQSCKGIHILIKGKKPGQHCKSDKIEIYDSGKYFALTGNLWQGAPGTIEEHQTELDQLYGESFTDGSVTEESDYKRVAAGLVLDPKASVSDGVLKKLLLNEKFRGTWEHERGFASLSEYDLSLASIAADMDCGDQEIANLIITFRRDHGTSKDLEKALRQDYIPRIIAKVRSSRSKEYSHALTDVGNAMRFAIRHGINIKYCHPWKKWLVWDGTRWKLDDLGAVIELAKETIRSMYYQAANITDDSKRDDFVKSVRRQENNTRIKAMIELAQSIAGVPVLPSQLDTDPWKLNVQNGTVDLETGRLLPHERDDLITKLAPVNYLPEAQSNLFEGFLERVIPDDKVRDFVQKVAGYSLYGRNEEEIILFVYGPPASGKSTFLEAIKSALGDYATIADFGAFLKKERSASGPRADIARLARRRLVISLEVQEGAKLDEALVNQLTGMDTVTARHLYQESFEYIPQFTIWLAANNRPQINDPDGGIWRRIREIPFDQVIPEKERNRKLKKELCDDAEHRNAVFCWLVKGCLAWQLEGLEIPEAVVEATADYKVFFTIEKCTKFQSKTVPLNAKKINKL